MATTTNVKVPVFDSVKKPYEYYVKEIDFWVAACKVPKRQQGVLLAYELPQDDPSGIREKLFSEIDLASLNADDGVQVFKDYMDGMFKKDELMTAYETHAEFHAFERKKDQKLQDFLIEFDKLYNRSAQYDMTLSSSVLCFRLLDKARLSDSDRQLIMTGIDYSKKDTMYEQARTALRKFKGDNFVKKSNESDIRLESVNISSLAEPTEDVEEALAAMGFYRHNNRDNSRGRGRGRARQHNNGQARSTSDFRGGNNNSGARRGSSAPARGSGSFRGRGNASVTRQVPASVVSTPVNRGYSTLQQPPSDNNKPMNPTGADGEILKCKSCGSFRHLLGECPHSYENMQQSAQGHGEVYILKDANGNEVEITLFAEVNLCTNDKDEISLLAAESSNKGVLDSGCTKTVSGREWIRTYLHTLDEDVLQTVIWSKSEKYFKFGSGDLLKSLGTVDIPCYMGGKLVRMNVDVVDSNIPLLISKQTMKGCGALLDLVNDRIRLFDNWFDCDITSCGHYAIDLHAKDINIKDVIEVTLVAFDDLDVAELKKKLFHIHRQFGHPPENKFIAFLEGANKWKPSYQTIINEIYASCETCQVFKRSPPRPVSALPVATLFGEVLTMDLKEWGPKYILHMIDAFTRFTVSTFISNKTTKVVIDKVLERWIAIFGTPKRIWSDLGGEFNSEDAKEMSAVFGVEVSTTAGYAAWMNGLNERNHAVVDRCLQKILHDNPKIRQETALCWAVNAKNSLLMNNGFSSYQLVFGKNPNVPLVTTDKLPALEGVTTSETVAEHVTALHAARRAFIESESDERIRRALRNRIKSVERAYKQGDKVYYKREIDGSRYLGPALVIGHRGSVVIVEHQGKLMHISAARLRHVEEQSSEEEPFNIEEADTEETAVMDVPKSKDVIKYRKPGEKEWKEATVLSRAGKQTAKKSSNKWCVNIMDGEKQKKYIDLKQFEWKKSLTEETKTNNIESVNLVVIPRSLHAEERCVKAKNVELNNFKQFEVYTEVKDEGQFCISSTWHIVEKVVDQTPVVKARLVARGFEEKEDVLTDSPTVSKNAFRCFLALSAAKQWPIESTDIKSAFLQGEPLDREVFIEPPPEAKQEGIIWLLNKCMYGLNDASRKWFEKVKRELLAVGCFQCKLDPAVFTFSLDGELRGIIALHVDDFLHIGESIFKDKVIRYIRTVFMAGETNCGDFNYLGLEINQSKSDSCLSVSQQQYIDELKQVPIPASRSKEKNDTLSRSEQKQYMKIVGQLNWASQQTRPDITFEVMELSMKFKHPHVADMLRANKAVKKIQTTDSKIMFPKLNDIEHCYILTMSDAAFANLQDNVSSGCGHIILLVDPTMSCCTLSWKANKIKRVVRSTLAAEALALQEAIDTAIYLRELLREMHKKPTLRLPIEAWVDNNDAFDAVHLTKLVADAKLRIDIADIKESMRDADVVVKWCPGDEMIANSLTKRGANSDQLLHVLSGLIDSRHFKEDRVSGWKNFEKNI